MMLETAPARAGFFVREAGEGLMILIQILETLLRLVLALLPETSCLLFREILPGRPACGRGAQFAVLASPGLTMASVGERSGAGRLARQAGRRHARRAGPGCDRRFGPAPTHTPAFALLGGNAPNPSLNPP